MAKAKSKKKAPPAAPKSAPMTTGEATVAALIAHGLKTVYALPGIHNDHFFDALHHEASQINVVHTRHEQGAAYMALGAALATGKPQAYAVVPGPGLLNSASALLNAYGTNAQVLAIIGQIPHAAIGKGFGHLHEIRDQAGIIDRLVDYSAYIESAAEAPALIAKAFRAMASGRRGPAALECAIDVWGQRAPAPPPMVMPPRAPKIDDDAVRKAAKLLGAAKRVLIVCGGGALDASPEVAALTHMLQAGVLGYRRGRGVLDSRDPLSVTLPLGRELWGEADVIVGIGTRMLNAQREWGLDKNLKVVRIDADAEEISRFRKPTVGLAGDAAPILRRLIDVLPTFNTRRASRRDEMTVRQGKLTQRLHDKLGPQMAFVDAIRAALPEDGIYVDEVTQVGFVARLGFPVYKPRTFLSPGFQDNLGWGYATALGAQHARPDVPVVSINGDGGFLYTGNELATAIRHRIPLTAIVFADGAFGNVRRIQEEQYGNRLIACDLANPDFVKYAESFGAAGLRARTPDELRAALQRSFAGREPTLIEVPVGAMPSPWEFIHMPRVRAS
ncbi:MAG TPA: thiamine pyrophosphate-dependent enzyme [Pseudolabrys sp.]|nr:thiamine pyrophosphate-dependent enzyme [Pseudolabrys sp.]